MAVQGDQITLSLDELFKDDSVTQWFPKQSPTYKRIAAAKAENINAKGGLYLIEKRRPQAIVSADFASSDGNDFPVGGKLAFLQLTVTPITHRASVEISSNVEAQNEAQMKQRPAKDYNYVLKSIKSLIEAYGVKQSRDLWGDRVGEIARASAVNSGTITITCNTAANLFGAYLVQPGMDVEFRTSGGTLHGYGSVVSIDRAGKTFIMENVLDSTGAASTITSAGITTNDRIYMKGTYNACWNGVQYLTAPSGAFEGQADRTGHYRLPGMQEDMSGATMTIGHLRKMRSDKEMRCDGTEAAGEFYGSTQIDAYEATGLPTQVYGQSGDTLKQGYNRDKMMFDSRGFNRDIFIARDAFAFLDLDQIDKFEMQPFKPLRAGDGSYEHLGNSATTGGHRDAKLIYMRGIGNMGTGDPSSLGVYKYGFSTSGLSTGNV